MLPAGKCPECKSPLQEMTDTEGRKWAQCLTCKAQFPLTKPQRKEVNYAR